MFTMAIVETPAALGAIIVGNRQSVDSRSDGLDDAGALVTQDHRLRHRVPLIANDGIGVADAGGDDSHSHLICARIVDLELAKL